MNVFGLPNPPKSTEVVDVERGAWFQIDFGSRLLLVSDRTTRRNKATPYNKRKQKKFDGDRDLREQFSFSFLSLSFPSEFLIFFL